jgi:hypothetical protein
MSGVTFNWIISNTSAASGASELLISSSSNPFAISFSNATLTLLDAGSANDHYAFSVQLDKYVQPPMSLDSSDSLDGCWFRGTTLSAALYTKKKPDSSVNATAAAVQTGWLSWPNAVEVNQTINGGNNVPACFQIEANGNQGPQVTNGLSPQPQSDSCGCFYRNYGLS